ncbi:hypothetical protein B0A48_02610 [Cryoendolithus antarcticus]|uniref:Uncharacterized protein n=1 Tax=Cryoendolithus antarcticus TaxID=1507870 RepID=A0A1V8TP54_9PEZI|nr:hypothetical protein B0A48_02610 [Cryoendolithus antarcticus]
MGLFDGESSTSRSHSYGGRASHSPSRGAYTRPSYARSASSVLGGSSRGIFSSGGGGSGSSYYKRRPRDGYVSMLIHKLQRMIKELWYYARRHPVKAFFAVVVPLLSAGGAVGGLLKGFGVHLPSALGAMGGQASRGGGGYYGSSGYGAMSESSGWMGNAGSLMSIAKAFM